MRVLHSHLNWLRASQEFELVLELRLVGIDPVFESAHLVMEMVFSLVFVVTTPDNRANRLIWRLQEWGLLEGRYEQESDLFTTLKAVRITPLYRACLRFDLDVT